MLNILYVSNLGVAVGASTLADGNLFQVNHDTTGLGLVSTTAGQTAVIGVGTAFTRELMVGEAITVNGESRKIADITDNEHLVTDAWTATNVAAGFTIAGGVRAEFLRNGTLNLTGESSPDFNYGKFYYHIRWNKKYTDPDAIFGLDGTVKVSRSSDSARRLDGCRISNIISEDNTGDWTGFQGIASSPFVSISCAFVGATGTIAPMKGYHSIWNNQAPTTLTVTSFAHYNAAPTTSACESLAGLMLGLQSGGEESNVQILSGTDAFPEGDWAVYEASERPSYFSGVVGFGTDEPADSARVEISSTNQGFLPPRMTTAQRDAISSPAEGLEVYNLTTHKKNFYNGTAWEVVTSQ